MEKGGLSQLLEEKRAGQLPDCDTEQLALFADVHEAVQAGKDISGVSCADSLKRKPGRPKGALNNATKEMRGYLRNKYAVMPLEFLVGLVNQSPSEIVKETGCKAENVIKVQTAAAVAALPYLHQKMPMEVAVSETKRHLVVMEGLTSEVEAQLRAEDAIIVELDENGEAIEE